MSYTALTHVATGDLATAALHNTLLDNLTALVAGLPGQGFTLIDLLGAAAPAVSAAGHVKIIYNTSTGQVESSINGGAFDAIDAMAMSLAL